MYLPSKFRRESTDGVSAAYEITYSKVISKGLRVPDVNCKIDRMYIISLLAYTYLLCYALAESYPGAPFPELLNPTPNNVSSCEQQPFMLRPTLRKMTNFNIEIVSDPVCPWCYIGKKNLDKAIETYQASHPEDTFTRSWKPFYVKPHSPLKG